MEHTCYIVHMQTLKLEEREKGEIEESKGELSKDSGRSNGH